MPAPAGLKKFRKHPYGAAVVGKAEAALQRETKKSKRDRYGSSVTGAESATPSAPPRPPAPSLTGGAASSQEASLSVPALEKLLAEEPARLDRQIDAEFLRAEGPRKGAIRAFLQVETNRAGGPRADVMSVLERALRPSRG